MKLQNTFRVHLVVMGFAAALFFAGSAPAQEIENTTWNDGAYVAALAQPTSADMASDVKIITTDSDSMNTAAVITRPIVAGDAVVSQVTSVEVWLMVSSLFVIALLSLYALAEAKRIKRTLDIQNSHASRSTALS
jgi:hypothetical protein